MDVCVQNSLKGTNIISNKPHYRRITTTQSVSIGLDITHIPMFTFLQQISNETL